MSIINLLKQRNFLPLFIVQFLGAFNDNLFRMALVSVITFKLTTISPTNKTILVTLALAVFMLPFFLLSTVGGQLADKYNKDKIIKLVKFAEILIIIIGCIGLIKTSISLLMLGLFLMGCHSAIFGPVKYSILPDHLKQDELVAANGLIEAATFIAILAGTIISGIIATGESLTPILMLTSITAILGFAVSLFIPTTKPADPSIIVNFNVLKESLRLISLTKGQRRIYLSILGISWFWLIGGLFIAQLPNFTKNVLQANSEVFTLLLTIFSIGIALGSIGYNKLVQGKLTTNYIPIMSLLMTLFLLDFSSIEISFKHQSTAEHIAQNIKQFLAQGQSWHILIDLFMIAATGGMYIVPLYSLIQCEASAENRSQIIAANNIVNSIFIVAANLICTLLLFIGFSISSLFLIAAIANAIVTVYICTLLPETLIKYIFKNILKRLYKVKVVGLEHLDNIQDKAIIIANHTSFLDAALLALFLPDKICFAIDTLIAQKKWIKPFLFLAKTFSVDPTNPLSIKAMVKEVNDNNKLVIFPEGRITVTGSLMKIYEGPALIAEKTGAPIIPIRIEGAQYSPFSKLKGKVKISLFPSITLTILPVKHIEIDSNLKGRQRRAKLGIMLYEQIKEMMLVSSNYKKTLFTSLIEASAIHGGSHEIVEDINRKPLNYRRLITSCLIFGSKIKQFSKEEENIGVMLPSTLAAVISFFALNSINRVPAMLNFTSGLNNIKIACKTALIKNIITSSKFIEQAKLSHIIDALINEGIKITYLEEIKDKITIYDKLSALIKAVWLPFKSKHNFQDPNSPAVILFTSGSEGTPKAVVLTNVNLQCNRYQISSVIDFSAKDVVLNVLPIFHSYGLTGGTILPILFGVKVFFYPTPLHYRVIPEISYQINATIFFGTDSFLANYARFAHPYDFYSIRYVVAGAERLKETTRKTWINRFGIRIFEGYGATETAPVLAVNTPMQYREGTVGKLLPGIEYKLEKITGIDQGGRLLVKGTNIMSGYIKADNPGILVPPEDGWYDTGDIVDIDEEGYLSIKGRAKRFAKISGEMVSLTAIEEYVQLLWPDHQHAVISIDDHKKGEQIVLVTTNTNALKEQLLEYAKSHGITELAIPKKILTLEKLPLLGNGKTDYITLKQNVTDMTKDD